LDEFQQQYLVKTSICQKPSLRKKITAIFEWFGIFPHLPGYPGGVEKCQTIQKLHLVVWNFL
jgi:hypothetical protein